VLLPAAAVAFASPAQEGQLLVQTSAWTRHYENRPYHNNDQNLVNLEWIAPQSYRIAWLQTEALAGRLPWTTDIRWLAGAALFENSFSQSSTYLYGGGRYDFWQGSQTRLYAKITLGLLHGYRGEFRDKIPLNHFGVAPAVLPAVGVQHRRVNLELIPFGAAGVMLNIGLYFPE
jgi:hypothetical protein